MKIVIDARMYGLEHKGIGRYILNLINQIKEIDKENEYLIILRKKYFNQLKFKNKNVKKILGDFPHYSLKEQVLLPLLLFKLKPELAHFPHFNTPLFWWGSQVVTIHDLIKHEYKGKETTTRNQVLYWLKYLAYRFLIFLTILKAAKIITPSQWWQARLVEKYKFPEKKIKVIYEGADEFLKTEVSKNNCQKLLSKFKIKKPFIIYVGNLYPHKNIENLIKALKILNQKMSLNLVIVSSQGIFQERLKKKLVEENLERKVRLINFLKNESLACFYQQAEIFVYPSFLEGFGLPGLEAMVFGLPVVASNSSCFPEIYGKAALYFDPLDINQMSEKILEAITDQRKRKDLVARGLLQVKKYSWKKMAQETIKIYQDLKNVEKK